MDQTTDYTDAALEAFGAFHDLKSRLRPFSPEAIGVFRECVEYADQETAETISQLIEKLQWLGATAEGHRQRDDRADRWFIEEGAKAAKRIEKLCEVLWPYSRGKIDIAPCPPEE